MEKCHNCSLPQDATGAAGQKLEIRVRAENAMRRDRTATVWACSPACALQTRAIAEMGPSTHKWPITLAQFAGTGKGRK